MLFPITLLLSFICGYLFPWWVGCIIAFGCAMVFGKTSALAFWSGFAALALAWIALALLKSFPNDHILATRVAQVFHLPNWLYLLAVTALIGGLAGGFSSLSGLLVKRAIDKT